MAKHRRIAESPQAPETATAVVPQPTTAASSSVKRSSVMTWPLILISLVAGFLTQLVWGERDQPDDWASLWIGGVLVDKGQIDHLYDHNPVDFSAMSGDAWLTAAHDVSAPFPHPFVQNPLFAQALSYLTKIMSFDTSVLWLLFGSGAAVVVIAAASYFLWFNRPMPWGLAALVTVVILCLPATINSLWLGQTTPLIVAGVIYGLAASRTRPWLAGIILGLVASIKLTPYALIVVMLFFAYRRRAALWALGTTAVLVALMFISIDMSVISTWLDRLETINSSVLVGAANQSIASMLASDLGVPEFAVSLVTDYPDSVKLIPLSIAIVVTLLATAVAWWNPVYRFQLLITSAWLIATAFSSIVWTHYMIVLVVPVMGFAAMSGTRFTSQWPYVAIAALVGLLSFPVTNPIGAIPFTSGYAYSGTTAMLVGIAVLLLVGGCHAAAVRHSAVVGSATDYESGSVGSAVQPEPMILFDLFKRSSRA
ncbi:glycosyltransferase family 87 protein [uncultured Corynebacterium sp.]|uniref:glycosyltransferase family 87 protein n=1 Tax=uncultured Corynebacterium sp. TaxID=159447 RepID=UPI00261CA615|nr:glycosyltransferase family 87 protein [uncultured Corynebacterium sp.]